jgi:hypothetical protein
MGPNQAHHQRCRKDTEKSRPQDEDNRIYAFPDEGTPDGPRPESFPRLQDFHFSHHKRIGKLAKPIFQKTCQDNTLSFPAMLFRDQAPFRMIFFRSSQSVSLSRQSYFDVMTT